GTANSKVPSTAPSGRVSRMNASWAPPISPSVVSRSTARDQVSVMSLRSDTSVPFPCERRRQLAPRVCHRLLDPHTYPQLCATSLVCLSHEAFVLELTAP